MSSYPVGRSGAERSVRLVQFPARLSLRASRSGFPGHQKELQPLEVRSPRSRENELPEGPAVGRQHNRVHPVGLRQIAPRLRVSSMQNADDPQNPEACTQQGPVNPSMEADGRI